jgi:hypothetical protein
MQLETRIRVAADFRLGSLADMGATQRDVRFTPKADIDRRLGNVRFVQEAAFSHPLSANLKAD